MVVDICINLLYIMIINWVGYIKYLLIIIYIFLKGVYKNE